MKEQKVQIRIYAVRGIVHYVHMKKINSNEHKISFISNSHPYNNIEILSSKQKKFICDVIKQSTSQIVLFCYSGNIRDDANFIPHDDNHLITSFIIGKLSK